MEKSLNYIINLKNKNNLGRKGTKDSQGKHGMFVRLTKEEQYGATCWGSKKNQFYYFINMKHITNF